MKKPFKILSPTAILGYGFPQSSFEKAMAYEPDVIAVDAGSTDPGPYYLGAGESFTDRDAVKRDLTLMITAGVKNNIPVCIGSAGGSGAKPHTDLTVDIIKEIAKEQNISFKMAVIYADVDKGYVLEKLRAGKVTPLSPAPELTEEVLKTTTNLVAQMGVEPFIEALDGGAQVVLAGRGYDPSVFSALAIKNGYDEGLATHLGKILECACIASTPGSGSDCMMGWLYEDHFEIEPMNENRRCTELSVAAHTLYEKTNPYILPGPGGILDLSKTVFTELNDRRVAVAGSRHVNSAEGDYTLKLEGARLAGYRTVSIAGSRDPIFIKELDNIIAGVRARVSDNFKSMEGKYNLSFIVYGKNGVMGELEPVKESKSHEVGIVIEAVAETQDVANTICSFARSTMLHYGYEGRISTAGNLAFPYSPSDFKAGAVYVFSVYHLLHVSNGKDLFPVKFLNIDTKGGATQC